MPVWPGGGSRKLFWEGHIGLESPKTMKRGAYGVEEMSGQEVYPLPSRLWDRGKLLQRCLGRSPSR